MLFGNRDSGYGEAPIALVSPESARVPAGLLYAQRSDMWQLEGLRPK